MSVSYTHLDVYKRQDLIQAGYKPGPELGEVLKEMLEHVLEEPSDNTKEKLMEFINKEKY